jgi:hypothetical protein
MKSFTAIALILISAGSLVLAQNSTSINAVSCEKTQTDSYCNTQSSTTGLCCASVITSTKGATSTANVTNFQCLPAELVKANSSVVFSTTVTYYYSCVENTASAVSACTDNNDCSAGACCASRNVTYRATASGAGTGTATVYAQSKACTT